MNEPHAAGPVITLASLHTDTIAAVATPAGRGGIGIVRVSGPACKKIAQGVTGAPPGRPRTACLRPFRDQHGSLLDRGLILHFPAPNSFTGEDVLEFHCHGSPILLDLLLASCCAYGARLAEPGEFSRRAYLNDKLDLNQAEAIADLINSETAQAVRNATRSLEGVFSERIATLLSAVTTLRVYVEAAIDFPEEEIDFLSDGRVEKELQTLRAELDRVIQSATQGALIREGMTLVLAGKPNAGKSSLLNALSGRDTAIVTDVAGTTRDILREQIQLDGLPLHIIDTAGLRDSEDQVEQEGIRRAHREIARADQILLVLDDNARESSISPTQVLQQTLGSLPAGIPIICIHNKCDLSGVTPHVDQVSPLLSHIWLSARSGAGLELLREHLRSSVGLQTQAEDGFSARRRHLQVLQRAAQCLDDALTQLQHAAAGELIAEDLRACHDTLGEISGRMSSDELLGEIFSTFCIGK